MFRLLCHLWAASALAALLQPPFAHAADGGRAGVLILGDSNSEGPFGLTLHDTLRALRDPLSGTRLKVSIYAKCGAGARDWTNADYARIICTAWERSNDRILAECAHVRDGVAPSLQDLYMNLDAPRKVTLVALGLNMEWGGRELKQQEAADLIAAIGREGSACVWIGPPQAGPEFMPLLVQEQFMRELKATVIANGCRYISSDDKTDRSHIAPKEDHYSEADSIAWAERVLDELQFPRDARERSLFELLGAP